MYVVLSWAGGVLQSMAFATMCVTTISNVVYVNDNCMVSVGQFVELENFNASMV